MKPFSTPLKAIGRMQTELGERPVWLAPSDAGSRDPHDSARVFDLNRPVVKVAVGILIREDSSFLMTTRPKGKVYEGYWEFPGGKLEEGESVHVALSRELLEELGLQVQVQSLWQIECFDYPHALVQLYFCRVTRWLGEPQMREGQTHAWVRLPVTLEPILPGAMPVLQHLQNEWNTPPIGG